MSVQARVNQLFGANDLTVTVSPYTSSGNSQIDIPAIGSWINLSASAVTTLGASGVVFTMPSYSRGRLLFFYNSGSNAITFTNTNDTTTAGYMDLGGSHRQLDNSDILCVYVRSDGSAIRVFSTLDNT